MHGTFVDNGSGAKLGQTLNGSLIWAMLAGSEVLSDTTGPLLRPGARMWTEVAELGELIRSGKATWEDLDLDDVDTRLKWAGLFHRRKRAPGTFMMRLKVSRVQRVEDLRGHGPETKLACGSR